MGSDGGLAARRAAREHEFSRRELLRAGWALPVGLSLGGLAAACGGDGGDERVHGDHGDKHSDTTHSDAGLTAVGDHLDAPHGDELHTDTGRYDHVDTPHGDHTDHADAASPSTKAGHSDTSTTRHSDVHSDQGGGGHSDHGDTAHVDTSHGDVAFQDASTSHSDGYEFAPPYSHLDTPASHSDVPHTDTPHSDVAHVDQS